MKKYKLSLFSILFFILHITFAKSNPIENNIIKLRQSYQSIIDTKLFESKTTSFSKSNDGTIYAGRYSYGSKLEDSSILKTNTYGQSWEKIERFPSIENAPKIFETIVKVAPNDSKTIFVYFLTESYEIYPVVLKSNNSGESFEKIYIQNIIDKHDLGKLYTLNIHIDPNNSKSAYFLLNGMNNSTIYKYTENEDLKLINIDSNYFDIIISIEIGHQNSDILYAAGFTCLYKSKNAGESWETTACSSDFDNSFKKLKVSPSNDDVIYGIPYKLSKSSISEIIKLSTDGGHHWETKYSENHDSSKISSQGVSIDIDNNNPNKVLVTILEIDSDENTSGSKIIESLNQGQNWKLHEPDLGTYNIAADAIYVNNQQENLEYNVLLSSLFNLYKGKVDEEGYISNWSVVPFKYQ